MMKYTFLLPAYKSGYAFSLNNVANFRAEKVVAKAPWGVFGGNNVNNTVLVDCEINRYDIHCYGKNVRADRCKFSDLYNQYPRSRPDRLHK